MMAVATWGTWEELVLGGAVLRHGADDWDAVAAELRARTPFPTVFSPQECEAKYAELQERYSGCEAWFEELRKRRVNELKRELEKSENSIGSLQSKLETLSAERQNEDNFDYDTSRTNSPSPNENTGCFDASGKDLSKEGSSAGSFTHETGRNWLPQCQNLESASVQENDSKMEQSMDTEKEKAVSTKLENGHCTFKKKRGKRKRRGCMIVNEGSRGDSETVNSAACIEREESSEACKQGFSHPHEESRVSMRAESTNVDLSAILKSLMEHKDCSVFQRRLDGQKRAKYKKMIRQHMDFQIISSKIGHGSASSAKELLRDLLLLANNALVFYPKNSTEHKSALTLRDLACKALRQSSQCPSESSDNCVIANVALTCKSKNNESMRPCNRGTVGNEVCASVGGDDGDPMLENAEKGSHFDSPVGSLAKKRGEPPTKRRGVGRPAKGGRTAQDSPNKGRKRSRKR
ncbi:uncharacterized protein [Typha latifolia]|uniref:uncharacterized protein n=1 Tax=Typha latifolia TaxID=4733 RepID=UPI003C2C818C